jgi:hypothetical protein
MRVVRVDSEDLEAKRGSLKQISKIRKLLNGDKIDTLLIILQI